MPQDLKITVSAKTVYDGIVRLETKMEEMINHQKETNGKVKANTRNIEKIHEFKTRALTIWGTLVVIGTMVVNVFIDKFL